MSILGWGLSLLIPGGGIGLAVAKFGARSVFGKIGSAARAGADKAKAIPPKGWLAIGAVVALVAGFFVHQHFAHAARDAAYAAGKADDAKAWEKRLADMRAAALRWKGAAEAKQTSISNEIGARHEKDLRDIDARAGDQRLRGPGKAAAPAGCRYGDAAGVPVASGRRDAAGGAADPGVAGLPAQQRLAIVPWDPLVSFGATADANRAEVTAWREWYARQAEANRVARAAAPN